MTIPLPLALKRRMQPLPQWPPIALRAPQQGVQVRLATVQGEFDVTRAAVVASLRPLTIGVGLDAGLNAAIEGAGTPALQFIDLESGRTVGSLELRHTRNWRAAETAIGLFEVQRGRHSCVRWPRRPWNRWLQNRVLRKNSDPNNFFMAPEAVQQQMIFYICPRPVVLVSVDDGDHSNLFPMDLIGPVCANRFTLALRSTSPSIAAMKSARRVALSDVPARDFAIAYKLGIHHKNVKVDWERLPFAIQRSRNFSLRCPATALRVRELEILDFDSIGSHVFFVTQIASEHWASEDTQFFHTSGIYQHFRCRIGHPLPTVPRA
jgi:flavin reductase (DIM6/NTAB) family NADH-FMN oxidoreductase RutF